MNKIIRLLNSNRNKMICLIILGAVIRIVFLTFNALDVNVDEAMTAVNAKSILEYGTDFFGTSFPIYLEAWRIWRTKCCIIIYDCFLH